MRVRRAGTRRPATSTARSSTCRTRRRSGRAWRRRSGARHPVFTGAGLDRERWIAGSKTFPIEEIATRPALTVAKAWCALTDGDMPSLRYWTTVASEMGDDARLPDGTPLDCRCRSSRAVVGARRHRTDARGRGAGLRARRTPGARTARSRGTSKAPRLRIQRRNAEARDRLQDGEMLGANGRSRRPGPLSGPARGARPRRGRLGSRATLHRTVRQRSSIASDSASVPPWVVSVRHRGARARALRRLDRGTRRGQACAVPRVHARDRRALDHRRGPDLPRPRLPAPGRRRPGSHADPRGDRHAGADPRRRTAPGPTRRARADDGIRARAARSAWSPR